MTVRFFPVGPFPNKRTFKVEGRPEFDDVVQFRGKGPYQWTRHVNAFADGVYTATLTGEGLSTREQFTVDCVEGGTTTTTTAPPTTSVPATTTSAPPQARPAPVDDLPVTGAAVTGMAVLGLAALGLGGALVFLARRRRA
ncbi:LPXTG cell wall anchor domain-containing protein [Actinokineospora soli]|uniref:LPXTG cell wall anchor domain-containing protein n=1 Tax=Actinokineospora soli TaxID=1048753 RepID=A0ABW2THI0_9PSEU